MPRPALFIYTPRCIDEDIPTLSSPTSSVTGTFARSRPVSFAPSECPTMSSDCPTEVAYASDSSDYSDITTPATSTDHDALYMSFKRPQAPEPLTPYLITEDELHSRLTTPTIVAEDEYYARLFRNLITEDELHSRLPTPTIVAEDEYYARLFRNSYGEATTVGTPTAQQSFPIKEDKGEEQLIPSGKSKHRGFKPLRRAVSHIFSRNSKDKAISADSALPSSSAQPAIFSSRHSVKSSKATFLKSSSASLFSKRSRRSAKRHMTQPAAQIFDEQQGHASRQHLLRSRSFSGFPNMLATIADEGNVDEIDSGLDEATIEANEVTRQIGKVWMFALPANIGAPAPTSEDILFERGVERA